MKTNHLRKLLALLLCLVLVLGALPLSAMAAPEAMSDGAAADQPLARPMGRISVSHPQSTALTDAYLAAKNGESTQSSEGPKTASYPSSYNSNTLGYVTPVRNQGQFGTCWAHGAIASVESYMIKHGIPSAETGAALTKNSNLSEYHLAWYNYTYAYDLLGMLAGDRSKSYYNYLQQGGFGEMATYTLMRWEGPASETNPTALAYSNADDTNDTGLGDSYPYQYNIAHVTDVEWIPTANMDTIKAAIMEYGAGTFGYCHYQDDYGREPYFNDSNGAYCFIQSAAYGSDDFEYSNHDVTVVGWDDNYSRTNFNSASRPTSNGAWIIKNSWGTSTGDNGYCYISYEDSASLNDTCYFYKVAPVDNYQHLYQYDGTNNFSAYQGYKTNNPYVANVFTANGKEDLKAVSICTWDEGTSYTLRIYTGVSSATNPSSGTLAATQTGSFTNMGYHSVTLDSPIRLAAGEKYAVVFQLSTSGADEDGYYLYIPYDASGSSTQYVTWTHTAHSNCSFHKSASASSWTALSGGNFRIKAYTDDATEEPVPVTMNYVALGNVIGSVNGTAGVTSVTLPASATAAEGWEFIGWVAAPLEETNQKPSFYAPGSSFTLSSSVSALYALYVQTQEGGASAYLKVTDSADLTDGQYLIVNEAAGVMMDGSKSSYSTGSNTQSVSIEDGVVASNDTVDSRSFSYDAEAGTLQNAAGYYIYRATGTSGGSVAVTTDASTAANYPNTLSISGDNGSIVCAGSSRNYYLTYNTSGYFRYYANTNQQPIQLYKKGAASAASYTTDPVSSVHTHSLSAVSAVAPTCTEEGHTAYWYCAGCGKYFSDPIGNTEITQASTVIPALGHRALETYSHDDDHHWHLCAVCGQSVGDEAAHSWDEGVVSTEPTATQPGVMTYTCTACGHSRTEDIPALGQDYVVSFSVFGNTNAVDPVTCNENSSFPLPTASYEGYSFQGWVTEDYDNVSARPADILTGSYQPSANCTLIALFSYSGSGTGVSGYVSTAAEDVTDGQYLIGAVVDATDSDTYHFATENINQDIPVTTSTATAADGVIAAADLPDDAAVFTLTGNNSDGFTVAAPDGRFLGYTSTTANRRLALSDSYSDYTWLPTEKAGSNENGLYLQSRQSNTAISQNSTNYNSAIRSYYRGQSYTPIYLFKLSEGGATVYTTILPVAHEHTPGEAVRENEIAPTCTAEGSYDLVVRCTECGELLSSQHFTLDALGHDFSVLVEELAPTCTETGLREMKCSRCDERDLIEIPALGHDFQVSQVVAPTCTEEGYTEYQCSRCDATDLGNITEALGHDFQVSQVVAPTCTEEGYTEYQCSRCDATDLGNITEALGHDFSVEPDPSDEDHFLAPTCTEEGLKYLKCSRCDVFSDEGLIIPANGHTPGEAQTENLVEATATTDGSYDQVVYCTVCGAELSRETIVIPATGETDPIEISNLEIRNNISLGAEFIINYRLVNNAAFKAYGFDSFWFEFIRHNLDGSTTTTLYGEGKDEALVANGSRSFDLKNGSVPAAEMGVTYEVIFHGLVGDQEYYTAPMTGSLKSFFVSQLERIQPEDDYGEARLRLAADSLLYGAKAQAKFNPDQGELLADLSETALAKLNQYGSFDVPAAEDQISYSDDGLVNPTIRLSLQNRLEITVRYTNRSAATPVVVEFWPEGNEAAKLSLPATLKSSTWSAVISQIGAAGVRDLYRFRVLANGVPVTNEAVWSVESYVAATRSSTDDAALVDVLNAVLNFGDSVNNLFN